MIFRIQVEPEDKSKDPWWEVYDKYDKEFDMDHLRITDPAKWGKDITIWFNNTRSEGEKSRRFLKAEIIKELFVPVTSTVFDWYYNDKKIFELRTYGKKWNEKYIYKNRPVKIRKGYNTKSEIRGKIGKIVIGSIEKIFIKIPFKEIVPIAKTEEFALEIINSILPASEKYIAFEIINVLKEYSISKTLT